MDYMKPLYKEERDIQKRYESTLNEILETLDCQGFDRRKI